ncbi:hypothetical protein EDC04DRAFT_2609931 [Pisolithus marmoratus]|nr:hypothetical protein EDC04DRAFT_2609931 [Pisolithus marmoratus]
MKWVKAVSMPSPDEIAWFSLASVDPPLVDRTLTRFSAQLWQDGDTGWVCYGEFAGKLACIVVMDSQRKSVTVCVSTERSSDEVVEALEISVHDFKLEFPTGASIQVIAGLNCGFQGIVIGKVDDMYILQGSDQQASHGLANIARLPDNNCIQPGDFIHVTSGPHKGLCSTLHWYSSCEILITPSTLQQADPDNLRDKGKSKAQEPEVPSGDGDIDEGSDLVQVSVSMDEALIIPPSTLQFSRERGYDVTIGDCVRVVHGPAVDIEGLVHSVDFFCLMMVRCFCIKLENHSLHDIECQVGCELKNTAVITEFGMCLNGAILDSTRMAAFIELRQKSFVWTAPRSATPPMSTVDPSAEPGPSTLACDPWVSHPDDITPRPLNELVQANVDYRCVPWLFNNNFCDYANWHVCLRVGMSYNCGSLLKRVVRTMVPDRFSTVVHGHGLAPPGHVSVTVTSSTVSANIEHHFIPVRDLTPANPRSAGQYCLILHGKLVGQIHWVKKCQVKKHPKGVELEDGTKLQASVGGCLPGDLCKLTKNRPGHHINVDPVQFMSFLRYGIAPKIMVMIH